MKLIASSTVFVTLLSVILSSSATVEAANQHAGTRRQVDIHTNLKHMHRRQPLGPVAEVGPKLRMLRRSSSLAKKSPAAVPEPVAFGAVPMMNDGTGPIVGLVSKRDGGDMSYAHNGQQGQAMAPAGASSGSSKSVSATSSSNASSASASASTDATSASSSDSSDDASDDDDEEECDSDDDDDDDEEDCEDDDSDDTSTSSLASAGTNATSTASANDVAATSTNSTTDGSAAVEANVKLGKLRSSSTSSPATSSASNNSNGKASSSGWASVSASVSAAAASSSSSASSSSASSSASTGIATYFLQNGVAGACGTVHEDSAKVIALYTSVYGSGSNCGRTVMIQNLDDGTSTTATVADECPSCGGPDDIDLSVGAFSAIDSNYATDGVRNIKWWFTS